MAPLAGWLTIAASTALLLWAWFVVRPSGPQILVDSLSCLCGVGYGVGGLLLLEDVGPASWLVAPAVLAVCGVAHERALFGGEGPLRT